MNGIQEKAGVNKIKFHGMRHTFAILALVNGTQPHVVQRMLGHKRIEITLGIYGHVLPNMQEEAAEKMAALFCAIKKNGLDKPLPLPDLSISQWSRAKFMFVTSNGLDTNGAEGGI